MSALVHGNPVVYEEKHPWAAKRVDLNWSDFAGTGASISTSEWINAASLTTLTLSGTQEVGLATSVLVKGGADGETGYVENRVAFKDGRKDVITVIMPINTKVPAA